MDHFKLKPSERGQETEQVPRSATLDAEIPTRQNLAKDTSSAATHSGGMEAGDDSASSSTKPGIAPASDRVRKGNDALSSRIIERIVEVRRDVFGDDGIPAVAGALRMPHGTWTNYERGVVMPAHILLYFIDLTSVEPHWLLTGRGPKYRVQEARFTDSTGDDRVRYGNSP